MKKQTPPQQKVSRNHGMIVEIWHFVKTNKKWWLLPMLILLLLAGVIAILGQSGVLSPFIYALG